MKPMLTWLVLGGLALGALTGSAGAAPVRGAAPLDADSCGADEFDGAALDTARWKTIVRPNPAGYSVSGGRLRLRALTGDMYGDRATAQNLILQDAPSGAWTATTRLDSSAFDREGQQAGLIVRADDSTFSKFTVIDKGAQGRWFEHIFTSAQQPRLEIGVDTTPPLDDSFPALVYIRVISDGQTVRGEYSGNGTDWAPIGRPAKLGAGVQLGVYAADNAQDGPEVPFDFVSLNAQSDEFAGSALEKCRWSRIVREDASLYRVAGGALELDTGPDEIDGTAPNLIGQPVPAGSWQAEAKVQLTTLAEGQQAGTAAVQGAGQLGQGRAGRQGRDQPDRARARQGRRLPARRAVQGRRPQDADELLPAPALRRHQRDRAVLRQRHRLDRRRQGARHHRPWVGLARADRAARRRDRPGHRQVRLRPRRRPRAGGGAEPVHHDRHHDAGDARERPDLPADQPVLAAGRADAALGHGRRGAERRRRRRARCGCPTRAAPSRTSRRCAGRC